MCRWHETCRKLYIITAHDDQKDLVLLEYDFHSDRFQIVNEYSLMPDQPMNIKAVMYDGNQTEDSD